MCPRKYDTHRRQAATAVTRLQILEAVRSILGSTRDLADFSMEAVAEKAGVARMTVYYQFHSRAALLDAVADYMAERGGMQQLREVFMEPDPERALRKLVGTFVRFWASDRIAMRRLRALGVISPTVYGGPRGRDDWRREAVSNLIAKFDRGVRGVSRPIRRAQIDLLNALTSFETFDLLCVDDRTPDAVAGFLTDTALSIVRGRPK
jgi:AcrR family transcriptional regulator